MACSLPHEGPISNTAARCASCVSLGATGRCFGRTHRNPFGLSDRSVLIRLVGGAALEKSLSHPTPYEPKSAQPTGSTSLLGGVSTGVPPWLMAVEAVATGESGITYRVSWGIETARTPEPTRTVEAETRPNDNLLGPRPTFRY